MDRRSLSDEALEAQGLRPESLEAANARLTREVETLHGFLHTLSHEMKTPLTSAREFICLVAEGVAGPLTIEQIEYLAICRNSCDQLNRIVNDLVDISRIETGKFSIQAREFTAELLVRELTTATRPRAERAQVALTIEFENSCGTETVYADLDRAKQVLGNLIDNALKFTPSGGKIQVTARVAEEHDSIIFSVRDTGPGIASEEQEKIFDRHYQTSTSPQGDRGGMGLGLNLCKELVELHGGKIWLKSTVGEGSEFCFTLPTARSANSPKESGAQQGSRRSSLSMTTLRSRRASASA